MKKEYSNQVKVLEAECERVVNVTRQYRASWRAEGNTVLKREDTVCAGLQNKARLLLLLLLRHQRGANGLVKHILQTVLSERRALHVLDGVDLLGHGLGLVQRHHGHAWTTSEAAIDPDDQE
jgi:hypothetical protein